MSEIYDVIVIGAGISGSTIFYLLNKYQIKTLLVEKSADIAGGGATKANSAIIHSGHDPKPGTLKAKLNVRGNYLWHKWVEKLNIPFYPTGAMVVATEEDRQETIYELKERAEKNGVEAYIISGEEARKREPHLTEKTTMALVTPTAGIIHPMRAAIAPVANGIKNGGELKLLTEVTNITRDEETGLLNVHTNRGIFKTRVAINAAGLFADKIMAMVGEDWFKITPRRGEYLIIDDDAPLHVSTVLFPTPTPISKGILVLPTVGMEVMIGPNAENLDKPDTATTIHGLQTVIKGAKKLVPFEYEKWAFASFAGLRPTGNTGDFYIAHSETMKGVIHVAGIDSPGLASAPAIAEMVVDMVGELIELKEKPEWDDTYEFPPYIKFLPEAMRREITKAREDYGKIVCRCREVSEGEIVDFIRFTPGVNDVDAIKRRLGVTGGHCGGTYCLPKIMEILAKEKGILPQHVKKSADKEKAFFVFVKGGDVR